MSRSAGLPEPRYKAMTVRSTLARFLQQENINFLLTNRVPRRLLTQFMGWFSQIEQPVVRRLSIGIWRFFADVDLGDAKTTQFPQHARLASPGSSRTDARPIDPDPAVLVSPCDAIVGACGRLEGGVLIQAKGQSYTLQELLDDARLVRLYGDGCYVTLRLSSGMYHRFHAPHDCRIEQVTYISGDTWNVNPIALKRVDKAVLPQRARAAAGKLDATGDVVTLVPVAAILVASIRLHFVDVLLHLKYPGPNRHCLRCGVAQGRGDWLVSARLDRHRSRAGAIIRPCANVAQGATVRMGQPLLRTDKA